MKTLYYFLYRDGKKTDYSRVFSPYRISRRSTNNSEYILKEFELELLVLAKFRDVYSNRKVEWDHLVDQLYENCDIVGDIIKYLQSKGKSCTKILSKYGGLFIKYMLYCVFSLIKAINKNFMIIIKFCLFR